MSDSATLWPVARQALLSTGLSWQEHWSGLPLPSPGALPSVMIEPVSPALQGDSLPLESPGSQSIERITMKQSRGKGHKWMV